MTSNTSRYFGTLLGQAVGDALGLATEFLSKEQVRSTYPEGVSDYRQIIRDEHRRRWPVGSWTDDTDQMICIMNSLAEHRSISVCDIASRFQGWAFAGGIGIGHTTMAVLKNVDFVSDPHKVAHRVWEATGKRAAANGGIMRSSVIGLWRSEHRQEVHRNAADVCRITHADPRCVASCVALADMIASLVGGMRDHERVLSSAAKAGGAHDAECVEVIAMAQSATLMDLRLDEGLNPGEENRLGYTYKPLAAAAWALANAQSFEQGLKAIVHEGGDADTNGAVVGAVLGARFGADAIPSPWASFYRHVAYKQRVTRFLKAAGVLA